MLLGLVYVFDFFFVEVFFFFPAMSHSYSLSPSPSLLLKCWSPVEKAPHGLWGGNISHDHLLTTLSRMQMVTRVSIFPTRRNATDCSIFFMKHSFVSLLSASVWRLSKFGFLPSLILSLAECHILALSAMYFSGIDNWETDFLAQKCLSWGAWSLHLTCSGPVWQVRDTRYGFPGFQVK